MKLAAAHAIANVIAESELSEDYIIPSVFNRDVADAVAGAVAEEAQSAGVIRGSDTATHAVPTEVRPEHRPAEVRS
jgi:malate dehydrogenase (oxaloacetate-decarboxylating)